MSEFQRATRRPATERSEGAQLGAPPERAYSLKQPPSSSPTHRSQTAKRNARAASVSRRKCAVTLDQS